MSVWMWIPYLNRQVELGTITREEADERIKHMIKIDNMPELIITEEEIETHSKMLKENSTDTGINIFDL